MEDDPLVAALRRYDPADHPLGTEELLAGSRRRAARIRTRRRAGVAVLALALVAVPVGVGVNGGLPGGTSRTTVVAADPTTSGTPVDAAQVLPDATVAAVLPGAVRQPDAVEVAGGDVNAGLCTDVPFAAAPLLGGRTANWTETASRQGVTESVRRFSADGAVAYVQTARDQAASCAASAQETGPWTIVGDGSTGPDDLVTAYAVEQEDVDGKGGTLYRVRGVVERDGVVVDVSATLVRATPDGLSSTVADLAVGGLDAVLGG
ncbi:sensor domain-containing protein [Kineococcus rhizosphaerae]|uniref:sensor domain-containing protein n=1 Tax=Kineococcus rhizosphaerae TaxID=559628 RepID=UPI001FE6D0BD|nr:sensor domain-containing protein [Kineococcus rhizosphaerae]